MSAHINFEIGERDRPGRSSRRLAGWSSRMNDEPNSSFKSRQKVCGLRPQTTGEPPALPENKSGFPIRVHLCSSVAKKFFNP